MKITSINTRVEDIELTRPYTITFRSIDDVQMNFVEISTDNGLTGIGCASPEAQVTGETREACSAALQRDALSWLLGRDPRTLPALCRELDASMPKAPAARAAVDIALHDLLAQHLGVPLQRVNELVRGKRGVTPETAWLLSQAFDTTPEFWLNLQVAHDLAAKRPERTVARLRRAS